MKKTYLLIAVLAGFVLISACKKNDSTNPSETMEPFSWLEEEAAQKWSRYHSSDGSTMYYILKGDRTACYFEKTSSGSRRDNRCYTNWYIDESNTKTFGGHDAYALKLEGSGITSYYSFVTNRIYLGGYSNLGMSPSTTSRECECD